MGVSAANSTSSRSMRRTSGWPGRRRGATAPVWKESDMAMRDLDPGATRLQAAARPSTFASRVEHPGPWNHEDPKDCGWNPETMIGLCGVAGKFASGLFGRGIGVALGAQTSDFERGPRRPVVRRRGDQDQASRRREVRLGPALPGGADESRGSNRIESSTQARHRWSSQDGSEVVPRGRRLAVAFRRALAVRINHHRRYGLGWHGV